MGKEEVQKNYTVTSSDEKGQVQISNEVVTIIAGLAATEVKGVASMVGNITNELVSKLGIKNLSKGVKIAIENDAVNVDLGIESGLWFQHSEDLWSGTGKGEDSDREYDRPESRECKY